MIRFPLRYLGYALALIIAVGIVVLIVLPEATVTPPTTETPVVDTPSLTAPESYTHTTIGTSVEGRSIEAYTFGTGEHNLLFVGGIHGGYEWNTVVLAYAFIDYFTQYPESIPEGITVHIIPSLNPDGIFAVTGLEGAFSEAQVTEIAPTATGRFNAHAVDLNRNFDCKWAPESTWRGAKVSAGSAPFSEPEAQTLRDYVQLHTPEAVVMWHSQGDAVYASECENGILPETLSVMRAYATASGYTPHESFDAYPITGDAEGWLASIGIPAVTVELSTHETVEWEQNLRGVTALLEQYSTQ